MTKIVIYVTLAETGRMAMSEDKLKTVLQEKLGTLAKPMLADFEKNFANVAASSSARDEIADKLASVTDRLEAMTLLRKYATDISEKNADIQLPDDKLHQYLQPILGTACTIVAVQKLEELNPELRGNEEVKNKLIQVLEETPEEDKGRMVAAAIKISKIKNDLNAKNDGFEFAGAYENLENITTRLLKNFYGIAKYAETIIPSETLTDDEKIDAIGGPVFSAQTIMLNDVIDKDIPSIEMAEKELELVVGSAAGGSKHFPILVQYVAEKSAQAAEIIFDNKEFRNFSKWAKEQAVQDAKKQALTGEKNTDMLLVNSKGIQNG